MTSPIFGTLTVSDLPFASFLMKPSMSEAVASGAQACVFLAAFVIVFFLTRYRAWGPMYRNWLISVDHKKVGIMYMVVGIVMLVRGALEGFAMRANFRSLAHNDAIDMVQASAASLCQRICVPQE